MNKDSVYKLELSGWQIDLIESSLQFALQDGSFSGQDVTIAEVLCENIKSDAVEKEGEQ